LLSDRRIYAELDTENFKMQSEMVRPIDSSRLDEDNISENDNLLQL
jgi:hypothetical protein